MPSACSEIIDDIEDLISAQDLNPRESKRVGVTVRSKRKKEKKAAEVKDVEVEEREYPESVIPGTQSIFVKTWGCTHNTSDSEYMAGLLASYGYNLTDNRDDADLWLLNSCTVKNPAEDHFRNEIEAGRSKGKCVVVAGCVSQGAPKSSYLKGLSLIGVQQIDRVVEVVEETLKGNSVRVLGQKKAAGRKAGGAQLSMPKVRRNPLIEIIAISTGCLNQCTYCKTKHARGELGSYPPDEIVNRAKEAFSEGVCEIWITSEDTGAYGRDIGSSLPELLWKIIDVIPDDCMMRVGMTNPPYILEHAEEMAKILAHRKVYSFIHIPVQSGSDTVLYDMKREYSRNDFEQLTDYLLNNVDGGVTIATDIICGFPTETEEDFEETMSLCSKYKFPSLFINQFYPRPGTPAARMPQVPRQQIKQRTKRLSELFSSYEPYSGLEGSVFDVLVTEEAFDNQHYVGHNKLYQQVLIPGDPKLMGKLVKVRIASTNKFSMVGEVLRSKVVVTPSSQPLESTYSYLSTLSILFLVVAIRFLWIFFL